MWSNPRLKNFVILFLVFCVASSKGIIIYNEETLVALSFISFVIFCFHYFGKTVEDSLNERSFLIKNELENFSLQQENGLNQLLVELQRIAGLRQTVTALGQFTERQIKQIKGGKASALSLTNRFNSQIQEKIGELESSKNRFELDLQRSIHDAIVSLVVCKMVRPGDAKSDAKGKHSRDTMRSLLVNQVKNQIKLLK